MRSTRNGLYRKLAVLALGLAALSATGHAGRLALAPGQGVPPMYGWYPDQQRVRIDWSAHEATLLNFWATWCEPCRREMPALQQLYDERTQDGLHVVGVIWESTEVAHNAAYAREVGVSYPILKPHRKAVEAWFGLSTLPVSVLVNREGVMVRRYVGATPEQLVGLIKDVNDFLDGNPLDPLVLPTRLDSTNPEIMNREKREEASDESENPE